MPRRSWPTTGHALAGRTKTRRVPTQQQFEPLVTAPMVSVTSRVVYILRRMLGGTVAKMEQLFSRSQSRSTNVATFLALLELVRGGRIALDDQGRADHAPHPPGTQ